MKFRPEIEGLRAVAVLLVLLSHFQFSIFQGGYVGVDVFFVISGFLITSLICHEYATNLLNLEYRQVFSLKDFYTRRAKRILPLSMIVILTITFISRLLLNPERSRAVVTDAIWSNLFLANFHFINVSTNYFENSTLVSPFQHFWTLAVEEQFYLIIPSLIFIVLSSRIRYIFGVKIHWRTKIYALLVPVCLISFSFSVFETNRNPTAAYFSSFTRVWELCLGAILAVFCTRHSLQAKPFLSSPSSTIGSTIGLLGILLAALVFSENTPMPGFAALLPTLSTCLLILGTNHHTSLVSRLLSLKAIRFVGRISFSVYLWHWPVLILVSARYPEISNTLIARVLQIIFVIGISTLSYYLIEKPFRSVGFLSSSLSRRKRLHLKRILGPIAFVSVVLIAMQFSFISRSIPEYQSASANETHSSQFGSVDTYTIGDSSLKMLASEGKSGFMNTWLPLLEESLLMRKIPSDMKPGMSDLQTLSAFWKACLAEKVLLKVQCTYGNSNAGKSKTALVFGDSFAVSALPAILGSLNLAEWKVDVLSHGQCMLADVTPIPLGIELSSCTEFRRWAFSYIANNQHAIIFISDNSDLEILGPSGGRIIIPGSSLNAFWVKQMGSSFAKISSSNQLVVTIGPPPQPVQSLGQCLTNSLEIGKGCFAKASSKLGARRVGKTLSESVGGVYIDLHQVLCLRGVCPPVIDKTPVLFDGGHITYEIAQKMIPFFKEQLNLNTKYSQLG